MVSLQDITRQTAQAVEILLDAAKPRPGPGKPQST